MAFEVADICATKFIPGEQWFTAGDGNGSVHVYAYTSQHQVKEFQAHPGESVRLLSVHPSDPLLLTAPRYGGAIKLWDWGQGWTCIRVFEIDQLEANIYDDLTFGPRDTDTCAFLSGLNDVKVCKHGSIHVNCVLQATRALFFK